MAALFAGALVSFVRGAGALLAAGVLAAGLFAAGLVLAALFSFVAVAAGLVSAGLFAADLFSAAGALYGDPACLAGTAPAPVNWPGLAVAAIAGRP